jgi:hypothetical protein
MKLIFAVLATIVFMAGFQKNSEEKPVKINSLRGVTVLAEEIPQESQATANTAPATAGQTLTAPVHLDQIIAQTPEMFMPRSLSSPAMAMLRQNPANAATEYIPVL